MKSGSPSLAVEDYRKTGASSKRGLVYQPPRLGHVESEKQSPGLSMSATGEHLDGAHSGTLSFGARVLILTYTLALVFPIFLHIGTVQLTATRLFLTLITIPVFVLFFAKKKPVLPDVLVLLYVFWASICLAYNHGYPGFVEPAGSHFFEVAGAYFLARLTMDRVSSYILWSKCLLVVVLLMLPFAIHETITGRAIILEYIEKFTDTYKIIAMEPRLGLERVQAVFEHPILYGVFCASAFSPAVLVVARNANVGIKTIWGVLISFATFISMSTGAYICVIWQLIMIAWNTVLKKHTNRWRWLFFIALAMYVVIDLLSNRTPFEVFVSYFTFDTNSAYNRINIWKFGTAELYRHPVFGIGLNEWTRADWMSTSFDNFWLLRAVRYGFPGFFLLAMPSIIAMRGITFRIDSSDKDLSSVSTAQLCALIGTSISLVTVDVWAGSHTFFFFTLGAIVALNQSSKATAEPQALPVEIPLASRS